MKMLSPTLVTLSIRLGIAGINQHDWPLLLLEVKQAYIRKDHNQDGYLKSPVERAGMEQSMAHPCALRMIDPACVCVYVNMIAFHVEHERCDTLGRTIHDVFSTRHEISSSYMSDAMDRNKKGGMITLLQQEYIKVFKNCLSGMKSDSEVPGSALCNQRGDQPFRQAVGCFLWVVGFTRPGINNPVRLVPKNLPCPVHATVEDPV